MNQFNKTVLSISVFVLIISLSILAFFLSKSLHEDSFPPIISDCPDYWDVSLNPLVPTDDSVYCKNNTNINVGKRVGSDTSHECYQPDEGIQHKIKWVGLNDQDTLCKKFTWANNCNVVWDGVTNNNKACDN
tara:strand:+ start:321 stop:716 length:396 start_codon:yes stop_codon:yes gene_type:complete